MLLLCTDSLLAVLDRCSVVMFSKITAFLHQAAEVTSQVLASDPQSNRQDEFKGHWKAITNAMTEDDESVVTPSLARRLEQMVDLLCCEEEEKDPKDLGTMGPCMEFVLRHKILDTLCSIAKSDYPKGIGHQVLLFFTVLLGRIERPILHHVNIHQPILRQVELCGTEKSGTSTTDQVQFIRTLCLCLQRDNRLADFFIKDVNEKKHFVLADALLRLVSSEDSLVVMKSYECVLMCVGLGHSTVSYALSCSQLPLILASQLQFHLQLIPPTTTHHAVMACQAGWGVDYAVRSHTVDHSPSTHGLWHVEAFLSWLDYCEQVVGSSQDTLSIAVCDSVHEVLLTASLLPKLLKTTEEDILIATAVLSRAIQTISCKRLLEEVVLFTLCEPIPQLENVLSSAPLSSPSNDSSNDVSLPQPEVKTLLREKLIERTGHISDEVCHITLQLFDILLCSSLPCVFSQLVLLHDFHGELQFMVSVDNFTREKTELEHVVTDFLSVVPEHLSTCQHVSGELGLEQYLVEAHNQVARCRTACSTWTSSYQFADRSDQFPASIEQSTEQVPSSNEQFQPYNESLCPYDWIIKRPFIAAVLNKLETLLDQPYEVNLILTSVLASLAAFPHPTMNILFAGASSVPGHHAVTGGSRTVLSILQKVSHSLQTHAERTPGLQLNIIEARRRLLGQMTSDLLSMPNNDLLEGAIILEEFSKELACLLFAKKTSFLLTLPAP